MILFDQLRISDDGRRMYINFHVNKADHFKDIYLDSLVIMTSDKMSETSPHIPTSDYIYRKEYKESAKEDHLVLTVEDFIRTWETEIPAQRFRQKDMSRTLFFIYVKVKGVPGACTPCRLDEETTLGVTFDVNMLYHRIMQYTRDLADDCKIPVGFTDFILLWNAFKASIETEHYIPAIKYFNMLFDVDRTRHHVAHRGCGCHG